MRALFNSLLGRKAEAPQPKRPEAGEMPAILARLFRSEDGAMVLEWLITHTLAQALSPDMPISTLQQLEGQRRLVKKLLLMIEQGQKGPTL